MYSREADPDESKEEKQLKIFYFPAPQSEEDPNKATDRCGEATSHWLQAMVIFFKNDVKINKFTNKRCAF